VWVTDGQDDAPRPAGNGSQYLSGRRPVHPAAIRCSSQPDGKLLMTLGTRGVQQHPATSTSRYDVLVAPNGRHLRVRRTWRRQFAILKFSKDGKLLEDMGTKGLATDNSTAHTRWQWISRGRLFVGEPQ
jgi:hypothetical protein